MIWRCYGLYAFIRIIGVKVLDINCLKQPSPGLYTRLYYHPRLCRIPGRNPVHLAVKTIKGDYLHLCR